MDGNLLQKSISRAFPNKIAAHTAEVILLLIIGMIAVTLHAKLRMPLHLPGRQGLIFMAILVMGISFSRYAFAGSISCLGASTLLFFNVLGFNDPFMPLVYLLLGFIIDLFFILSAKITSYKWLLSLAGGLAWMCIPLLRFLIGSLTGFPYHSVMSGILYPMMTYFIFGTAGSLLGTGVISIINRNIRK
jgi:hypothetical protein